MLAAEPLRGAEESGPPPTQPARYGVTVVLENDLFFDTDRYYTNGFSLAGSGPAWLFSPETWHKVGEKASAGRTVGKTNTQAAFGFELAQLMGTPQSIAYATPHPDDRPWAGLLYIAPSYNVEGKNRLYTFKVMLGVVGHWALADRAQAIVHRARGFDPPLGWHNQIPNEIVGGLAYEERRRYRYRDPEQRALHERIRGFNAELITSVGYKLGTIEDSARVGLEGRAGYRLPPDFGSTQIGSAGNIPAAWGRVRSSWVAGLGGHLFMSVAGTAVARQVMLDGTVFHGGPSIPHEPLVGRVVWGAALTTDHLRLSYQWVLLTREFRGQPDAQRFGSITVGCYW